MPSLTATAATARPMSGSDHHHPNHKLAPSPTRTAPARYAHSRFWVPSPAVAPEPRREPRRCFALPSTGMTSRLATVTATPRAVVPGDRPLISLCTDSTATYGASNQKDTATALRARSSAVGDRVRDP